MAETGAIAASTHRLAATGVRANSRFYVGIALTFLVIVVWGFTRSFYLRPAFTFHHALDLSGTASMPLLVVLHGLVISTWFVLFFAQVWLAATRRVDVHRQLGIAAVSVAALLVVLSVPTMILSIPRFDHAHIPREVTGQIMIGDSLSLVWFSLFVSTAVWLRRRADAHKRLMVLASISILAPAQARIGDMLGNPAVAIVGGTIALCLALAIHDYVSRKRLHRATVWGGLLIIVANPLLMAWLAALDGRYKVVDAIGRLGYALAGGGG
jgi:hypothetical protein